MSDKFSQPVLDLLRKAGWYEGRRILLSPLLASQFKLFAKAQEVLSEFGGLHIGECGRGIDCATSDVNIAPSLCVHLASELREHENSIGVKLFPLGEVHRGHGYLVIDENGKTYLFSDELLLHAPTFPRSLEALLLGKNISPNEGALPSAHT